MFASLGLPIRERIYPAQNARSSLIPLSSQAQCQDASPAHSQASQVMRQVHQMPSAPVPPLTNHSSFEASSQAVSRPPQDPRPSSSAPEIYSNRSEPPIFSLSQMLPPKRQLPFPSKTVVTPPANSESINPGVSQIKAADLPTTLASAKKRKPRPKATRTKKAAAPKRNRVRAKAKNRVTPTQSADLVKAPTNLKRSGVATNAESNCIPINPETICVPATPEATAQFSHIVISPISLSLAQPADKAQDPNPNPQFTQPLKQPPQNPPAQPSNHLKVFPHDLEPAEYMARLDTWVRDYHQTLPTPIMPTMASDSLAHYAAQSKEDRMAAVDQMLCECLEDPGFEKLAEDVEDSWKRIGLGF